MYIIGIALELQANLKQSLFKISHENALSSKGTVSEKMCHLPIFELFQYFH